MSSIKQLCKTGVVLKNGLFDFMGTADSAVDYYVGKYSQNDSKMYYPDLTIAPGNTKIRIRSMEVVDSKGGNITMDSDIDVKLQFYNYVANSMIDCTFELHTADDTVVFHRWLNFSPNHDSMVGEQSISFQIPKHLLNAGKYYFRIFFGENEAHLMW
jgi:lipopolysaccharide transport system ATP-binding protein